MLTVHENDRPSREEVAALWADPEVRKKIIHELARSLSKVGSFGLSEWLDYLSQAGVLSNDKAVELYTALRDESGRLELEWRAEFVAAFPHAESLLPPLDVSELRDYWAGRLFNVVFLKCGAEHVSAILRELQSQNVPINSLTRLDISSIQMGGPLWNDDVNDPNSISLVQFAEMVENHEAARLLRSAGMV